MTGSRRLLPVLATVALAASAAPARAQSGAGDDQYTDPFGTSTTKKTSTTPKSASKSQSGPPLSNQPPVSSSGLNSATTTTTPTPAPEASSGELPRTGFEVPGIALLGAGLLASGIGLRLRTVDESLF
jgi:hypothetical protein